MVTDEQAIIFTGVCPSPMYFIVKIKLILTEILGVGFRPDIFTCGPQLS